jgi:hypothetical protein
VLAVAVEYQQATCEWSASVYRHQAGTAPPGYDRLLLLPELGEITADHVSLWLEEKRVLEEQRESVIIQVMKGSPAVPARVAFERMKRQNIGCEDVEDD